nr:transcriptional regulator [Leucobacter sp.]
GLMHREDVNGGKRQEYRITSKALDFFDVTTSINAWAETWLAENGHSGLTLRHIPCENKLMPQYTCNACNGVLTRTEIHFEGPISDQ